MEEQLKSGEMNQTLQEGEWGEGSALHLREEHKMFM